MAYILENTVIISINSEFPAEERQVAMELLKNTKLWSDFAGPPARIHHAFIFLAKGHLGTLKNLIEFHSGDWRDALSTSGLASDDWKNILKKRGVDSSTWKNKETFD